MPVRDLAANQDHQLLVTFDGTGTVGAVLGETRLVTSVRAVNPNPYPILVTLTHLPTGRTFERTLAENSDVTVNVRSRNLLTRWSHGPNDFWDDLSISWVIPAP